MAGKVSVKGDDIHPLFKWLVEQSKEKAKTETDEAKKKMMEDPITWNFTKFLLNEKGELITVIKPKASVWNDEVLKYLN
jgi:glutathione peroxidase